MKMSFLEKLAVNNRLFDVWRKWTAHGLLTNIQNNHKHVLEIGCGKGTTTQMIANILPEAKIVATDIDAEQIVLAKKNCAHIKNMVITKEDASQLSFASQSFDAVFSFLTFHHIGKWRDAIKECHRVLKPDGIMYIDDLELKPFPLLQHFFVSADGVFSRSEFADALIQEGFTIITLQRRYKFFVVAQKKDEKKKNK